MNNESPEVVNLFEFSLYIYIGVEQMTIFYIIITLKRMNSNTCDHVRGFIIQTNQDLAIVLLTLNHSK